MNTNLIASSSSTVLSANKLLHVGSISHEQKTMVDIRLYVQYTLIETFSLLLKHNDDEEEDLISLFGTNGMKDSVVLAERQKSDRMNRKNAGN
jgi:hypothetical protein